MQSLSYFPSLRSLCPLCLCGEVVDSFLLWFCRHFSSFLFRSGGFALRLTQFRRRRRRRDLLFSFAPRHAAAQFVRLSGRRRSRLFAGILTRDGAAFHRDLNRAPEIVVLIVRLFARRLEDRRQIPQTLVGKKG